MNYKKQIDKAVAKIKAAEDQLAAISESAMQEVKEIEANITKLQATISALLAYSAKAKFLSGK